MGDTYVTFHDYVITTTVTSSGYAVAEWIDEIFGLHDGGITAAGLDVEWRPSFGREQNPVATLQVCVGSSCLVFQLLHADYLPAALEDFLGDNGNCFYGVGVEADADLPDLRRAGLRSIVEAILGLSLVKPRRVTLSRWDAQVRYACIDAFVSYEVARTILDGSSSMPAPAREVRPACFLHAIIDAALTGFDCCDAVQLSRSGTLLVLRSACARVSSSSSSWPARPRRVAWTCWTPDDEPRTSSNTGRENVQR